MLVSNQLANKFLQTIQIIIKMRTKFNTIAILLVVSISTSTGFVFAQEKVSNDKTTISLETDPSTFMFGGYALHLRIKPANSQHLVVGLGTYAMDMPDFFIGKENSNNGWNVRINSALSVFGEYYFTEANNKWFAGLQLGVQNYKNTNDNVAGLETKYSNFLVMPSIGYTWTPFKFPLYIKPWLGIGYMTKISGSNELGNYKYTISPIVPFPTVHIGYTF